MTDRKQVLFGLDGAEDRNFMSAMCDKADRAEKTHSGVYTKFLAPREQNMISERMGRFTDICLYGGYDGSERNIVCFYQKDDFWEEFDFPVRVLKIMPTNKKHYSHRDYLGSVLSLGIKREMIGDIAVDGEYAYVFCHSEIADYIIYNMEKMAHARVNILECSPGEIEIAKKATKEKDATVSSMRLDCVISAALNMSRGNSLDAVKKGLVNLNYEQIESPSQEVSDGDIISVRGSGKFEVHTDGTLTKKGRCHIHIIQYI